MEQFVTGHDRLCASFDRVMAARGKQRPRRRRFARATTTRWRRRIGGSARREWLAPIGTRPCPPFGPLSRATTARAGRYAGHAVHAGHLSATAGRAPFQACALTDGESPALCFGALADPPFSPYEEDSRRSGEGGLRSSNRTAPTLDFDAPAESMARFLPCDFPSSTDQSMQFALKPPVFIGMVDPAPALAAMRDDFIEIGRDRRVVNLTIRSRKARMAFFRSRLHSLLPRAHR